MTNDCTQYSPDVQAGGTDCKHCGAPFDQHLSTKDAERRWCDDIENACPCCGGSGHKDDAADHLKAAVAAELEACAQKVESNRAHLNFEAMLNLLRDTPLPEPIVTAMSDLLDGIAKAIRARTDADDLAALEQVKREAFQEGYEQAKADETAAIIAVKREAREEALWEAAKRLPRPKDASTWELDPSFVMKVTHDINRGGWEATMEVVEMAMLAAERDLLDKEPGQ